MKQVLIAISAFFIILGTNADCRVPISEAGDSFPEIFILNPAVEQLPTGAMSLGIDWAGMSGLEKMYWFLAVPASVLFLLIAILTFMGLGESGADADAGGDFDTDADFDTDMDVDTDTGHMASDGGAGEQAGALAGFHVFTVRNFIIFFMMFGWTGIAMIRSSAPLWLTLTISGAVGAGMMLLISSLFLGISKLVHSGNIGIRSAAGASGSVYLRIPANKSGAGKVTVVVEGAKLEFRAMTEGEALSTGQSIRVRSIIGNDMLLVEKL